MLDEPVFLIKLNKSLEQIFDALSERVGSDGDKNIDINSLYFKDIPRTFDLVNCSIMGGEYYLLSNALELINRAIERASGIVTRLVERRRMYEEVQDEINSQLCLHFNNLVNLLSHLLGHYKYLSSSVKSKLSDSGEVALNFGLKYELERQLGKMAEYKIDGYHEKEPIQEAWHTLTLINISLAELDEGYTCDNFQQVISHCQALAVLVKPSSALFGQDNSLLLLILNKAKYLALKTLRRHSKNNKSTFYTIDSSSHEVYTIEQLSAETEIGPFIKFDQLSRGHYTDSIINFTADQGGNLKKINEIISGNNHKTLRVEDYHFISKYVKRNAESIVSTSYIDKEKLLQFLDKGIAFGIQEHLHKDELDLFNGLAYESIYKLAFNAKWKIALVEKSLNAKSVKALAEILAQLKSDFISNLSRQKKWQFRTPDIYSYWLLADTTCSLLDRINRNLLNQDINLERELDVDLLRMVENVTREICDTRLDFKLIVRDAVLHRNMPVYLTYKECLLNKKVRILEDELSLFVDSAYILPVDYVYLEKKLNLSYGRIQSYINSISRLAIDIERGVSAAKYISKWESATNELKIEANKQREENDKKFEAKVKDSQLTAIQTIGIFSAIITFVLSNVKVFSEEVFSEEGKMESREKYEFLVSMASGFAIFVLLLKMIIANSDEWKLRHMLIVYKNGNDEWCFNKVSFLFWMVGLILIMLLSRAIYNYY